MGATRPVPGCYNRRWPMDASFPQISSPRWGRLLAGLAARQRTPDRPGRRARERLWVLLVMVLRRRIRAESRRLGPIDDDDLADLASEKALELIHRIDAGEWEPDSMPEEKIVGYVSSAARYGLIDTLRRSERRATDLEPDIESVAAGAGVDSSGVEPPHVAAERAAFVDAIVSCAGNLTTTHRTIWLFRVFLDMPSKAIAAHPAVGLKPGHIDVILGRCRDRLRTCVQSAGYDVGHAPPGTFAALWKAFRLDTEEEAREP